MTTYTATSTLEILSTNLSTNAVTGTNVTTLALGLGTPGTANMPAFVSSTITITAPTSDQISAFTTCVSITSSNTISPVAASPIPAS